MEPQPDSTADVSGETRRADALRELDRICPVESPAPAEDRMPGVLERLGPAPFKRSAFPLLGFLATVYEQSARWAVEKTRSQPQMNTDQRK